MRKFFLLLLSTLCLGTVSFAQSNDEAVHLKNGSIIRGTVIEQVPNKSIKIQTADGSQFVYEMNEVEKTTRGIQPVKTKVKGIVLNLAFSRIYDIKGPRGFVDLGFTGGLGSHGISRPELLASYGYQPNQYLFLGVGTGIQYFGTNGMEKFYVPIFGDIRTNFPKFKTTSRGFVPFAGLRAGYAFCGTDDFESVGMYLAPFVGIKYMISNKQAINVSMGYSAQFVEFYNYSYDYYSSHYSYSSCYYPYYSETKNLGGLSFKIGFEF